MAEEDGPSLKNPLSLNLSRVNAKQNGRLQLHPSSFSLESKPNANVTLTRAADPDHSKRRKKRKCGDLLRSLDTDIPIPKFDFELEQLQRDFFDDVTHQETDSESHHSTCSDSSARMDTSSHGRANDLKTDRIHEVDVVTSPACGPKKPRSQVSSSEAPTNPSKRPIPAQLLAAIEAFLNDANPQSTTVNHCFRSLEHQFGITLQRDEKTWARQQLAKLLTETQSAINTHSQEETDAYTSERHMPNLAKTDIVKQQSPREKSDVHHVESASTACPSPPPIEQPKPSAASEPLVADVTRKVKPMPKPSRRTAEKPQRSSELAPKKDDNSQVPYTAVPLMAEAKRMACPRSDWEQQPTQQPSHPRPQQFKQEPAAWHDDDAKESHILKNGTALAAVKQSALDKLPSAQQIILLDDDESSQDSVLGLSRPLLPAPEATRPDRVIESVVNETNQKPAPKRGKKKPHNSRCPLCIHCPCTFASVFESTRTISGGAASDEAVERALLRQLHTMEKNAEQYEDQIDTLRRRLKRHRKEMWQRMMKEDANSNLPKVQQRYLPDSIEMDGLLQDGRPSSCMPSSTVAKSTKALFSFAPAYQPTLTQMLGTGGTTDDKPKDCTSLRAIPEETADDLLDDDRDPTSNMETSHQSVLNDKHCDEQAILVEEEQWHATEVEAQTQRVEYGRGMDNAPTRDGIMDGLANGYVCQWDGLFDESKGHISLEELCNMLDEKGPAEENSRTVEEEVGLDGPVDANMLSQRGRNALSEILETYSSDSDQLQQACGNWQENVCFALQRREPAALNDALQSIRTAKANLQCTREAILEAATRRAKALELFETAVAKSLARLQADDSSPIEDAEIIELDAAADGFVSES